MPAVTSSARVLVTGGSGYLGAMGIKDLLERGFSVLAVFRRQTQADYAHNTFKLYGDKFTTTIIPDLVKEGALDEAVKDVDAVVHTASPVTFTAADPDELIGPALGSTLGLLRSAKNAGPRIKRIVITSSVGAIYSPWHLKEFRNYGPNEWNDLAVEKVKTLGLKSDPRDWYMASKTLAEQAAWNFIKTEEPSFDLVTVLPSLGLGPWAHEVQSKEALGSTLAFLSAYLKTDPAPPAGSSIVDSRDVAALHTLALLTEAAGGERLIASASLFNTEQVYQIIDDAVPPFPEGITPKRERKPDEVKYEIGWENARIFEIFPDFKFRSVKETILDHVRLLEQKGWLV